MSCFLHAERLDHSLAALLLIAVRSRASCFELRSQEFFICLVCAPSTAFSGDAEQHAQISSQQL